MRKMTIFLSFLTLLMALSGMNKNIEEPSPIRATVLQTNDQAFMEGGFSIAYLNITNISDKIIILDSISTGEEFEEDTRFASAEYGSVYYEKDRDAYFHNQMSQQSTRDVFHAVPLFPGENITVYQKLFSARQGIIKRHFKIKYASVTEEELRNRAYVQNPETNNNRFDRTEYIPYKKINKKALLHKYLLNTDGISVGTLSLTNNFSVKQRPVSRKEAEKKADIHTDGAYYSSFFCGWVLRKNKTVSIISKNKIMSFKNIVLDTFIYLDEEDGNVSVRFSKNVVGNFKKNRLFTITGWEGHEIGYAAYLNKRQILNFLKYCSENKYVISVIKYYFDRECLLIQ